MVATLNKAANEAIEDPAVKARLAEVGATTVGGTPEELATHVSSEITRWKPVIETAGAKIE